MDARPFLRELFDVAVAAADPMRSVPRALGRRPEGRVIVVGAGKASARMAEALEAHWGPCEGLVITRDGYARPTRGIEIVEASHPVPDRRGEAATLRMLDLLSGLGEGDHVVALISGGASALLVAPREPITLDEKREVNEALLASGATISEMNRVRKHLSRVKGGQLAAAAYPASVHALVISDVPGDDPAHVASGPTVGDGSSPEDALRIIERHRIEAPASVRAVLSEPSPVLRPDDPRLARTRTEVIAAPAQSLAAAASHAEGVGVAVELLGDAIEGEAREVAQAQAALALKRQRELAPDDPPFLLISGGECTVTRRGDGIGGPNAEFALALALALDVAAGISAISCDTDGVDGAAEVAGAVVDSTTLERAQARGLDPSDFLARNDAHSFFGRLGDQVVSGPTLTNVNDFRAILIEPRR